MSNAGTPLRPVQLGPLHLAGNLVLAPMHKRTHLAFRLLARRAGAALTHTEMATPEDLLGAGGPRKGGNLLAAAPEDRPLGIQVLPRDPGPLQEAVALVAERAAGDLVDLNFACPSRRVVRGDRGAAMLKDPDTAVRLVETAVRASRLPVTLKMRYGYTDSALDLQRAMEVARESVAAGAVAVTLHARTATQQYHGRADWTVIRRWVEMLPVPVFGSGDLRTPEAVLAMLRESGCAGASIARGALGAPWIFRQTIDLAARGSYEPATLQERRETVLAHFAGLAEQYGERAAVKFMRRFATYYAKGFAGASLARAAFQSVRTPEAFREMVEKWFGME